MKSPSDTPSTLPQNGSRKPLKTAKQKKTNALLDIFWTRAARDKFALLKQNARSDTGVQMPGED